MDLKSLIAVLARRKRTIIVTFLATILLTAIGLSLTTKTYTASTTLRFTTSVSGSLTAVDYEVAFADRLMNTYSEIAASAPVLDDITAQLELVEPPEFDVEIMANTELIRIEASSSDPELAAKMVNTLAERLIEEVELAARSGEATNAALTVQLTQLESDLVEARQDYEATVATALPGSPELTVAARRLETSQDRYATLLLQVRTRDAIQANSLTVVDPAVAPTSPSAPRSKLLLAMAGVVGLIGGLGLSLLEENFDSTLYSVSEIEALAGDSAQILGLIPRLTGRAMRGARPSGEGSRRLLGRRPAPALPLESGSLEMEEGFRRLRASIAAVHTSDEIESLMVVSAEQGAGKSTVVAHLARSFATAGKRVVAVDCCASSPMLESIFEVPNHVGLFDVQPTGGIPVDLAQRTVVPYLDVITTGQAESHAIDLLGSQAMESLVEDLKESYDVVLFDTVSLLEAADALVLAPLVDDVILVTSPGSTGRDGMSNGLWQLETVGANLVGIVVNRASGLS